MHGVAELVANSKDRHWKRVIKVVIGPGKTTSSINLPIVVRHTKAGAQ